MRSQCCLSGGLIHLHSMPNLFTCLVSTMPVGSTLAYVDDILLQSKDESGIHMVQLIDQFLT